MHALLGGGVYKEAVAEMKLTQTRRCGKAIVRSAQRFVPDFEAFKENHEGQVVRCRFEELEQHPYVEEGINTHGINGDQGEDFVQGSHYSLGEEDFVLCRTNAPLVGLAFRMLKAGKRVNIKGRDIGEGLKSFIKKSKAKDVSEFLLWLEKYQQTEAERIQKRRYVDSEALVTLEDKCMCLRTFADGAIEIKDLYKSIDQVFKGKVCPSCNASYDESTKTCWKCKEGVHQVQLMTPAGTMLSSIHRAKGMEAKRVFIIRPDLMPHKKAKTEWERGQEANLQYVAETRAIETLVYVDGKGNDNAEA
jgi:ribosomal protein L40E